MSLENQIIQISKNAKNVEDKLAILSNEQRDNLILAMADALEQNREKIKQANQKDLEYAKSINMSAALINRLTLDDKTIDSMILGARQVTDLVDPLGKIRDQVTRPNGLVIKNISVPIGVIGIIYESRPNVTVDVAAICIKSGNVVILKGGKEAIYSNKALAEIIRDGLKSKGMPEDFVQLIETTDREAVNILLKQREYIDLIIPRGGEGLIKFVAENSRIPILKHDKGVCHVYVDHDVDMDMAKDIIINAKCQRPGVCNAMETLLVHEAMANEFLPIISKVLNEKDVELKGCSKTKDILKDIQEATQDDWYTEYLDLVLSIKIVNSVDEAIEHINTYGSHHSDSIVTNNKDHANVFLARVNSAVVYHNASTRFTDGGEFGKGAEMGISTDKLHARGPVGIDELTTNKYLVYGMGQVR